MQSSPISCNFSTRLHHLPNTNADASSREHSASDVEVGATSRSPQHGCAREPIPEAGRVGSRAGGTDTAPARSVRAGHPHAGGLPLSLGGTRRNGADPGLQNSRRRGSRRAKREPAGHAVRLPAAPGMVSRIRPGHRRDAASLRRLAPGGVGRNYRRRSHPRRTEVRCGRAVVFQLGKRHCVALPYSRRTPGFSSCAAASC